MKTSTPLNLGSGTIWFKGCPLVFLAKILISLAFKGFQSLGGLVKRKVFLKHGAKGPLEFPGIQLLLCPHHPHPDLLTQLPGSVDPTLQLIWIALILSLPL